MRPVLFIALLAAAAGLAGCITPSIPIPPPDPSEMDFDITPLGDGSTVAVLTYPVDSNYLGGLAEVFDHNTGMGILDNVNADGSIGPTQPLPATIGDQVVVSVVAGPETVARCVVLQQGAQDPDIYCDF